MKKESIAKKILVSSLMGFPVGIALLMIAYICIYYIIGENIFRTEIGNLQNIETLISQMLTIGLSYYILFIHFHIFLHLYNKDVNDKINKHLYKTVSISLLSFIELIIAVILASTEKVFTKNISTMNIIILVILYATYGIFFMVKGVFECSIIKNINAKIQEKNKVESK